MTKKVKEIISKIDIISNGNIPCDLIELLDKKFSD